MGKKKTKGAASKADAPAPNPLRDALEAQYEAGNYAGIRALHDQAEREGNEDALALARTYRASNDVDKGAIAIGLAATCLVLLVALLTLTPA